MEKIRVFHFLNSGGGGVLSVVRNLLLYKQHPSIENHIIYTINKDKVPSFEALQLKGATSEQIFYYSAKWNFYHTSRQLAILLPDDKAVIIAHDWLELGMASTLGLQNPVVQLLHGDFDYYYQLSMSHKGAINAFIGISKNITINLKNMLPAYQEKIRYLNFPVPDVKAIAKNNKALHLIYYVRDLTEERKQFRIIVEIAQILSDNPDKFFFTIAGGGLSQMDFIEQWPLAMRSSVYFAGLKTNQELISLLDDQDIFLLPSLTEGFPVSLVEAMKAGAVPLVTNWESAADELIVPGETGYYFNIGAAEQYAICIKMLNENRQLLQILSRNSAEKANRLFDPKNNTKRMEDLFIATAKQKRKYKLRTRVYGSRLDGRCIPNVFTSFVRSFYK